MLLEYFATFVQSGQINEDLSIESTWPQEGLIQDIRSVCGRQHQNTCIDVNKLRLKLDYLEDYGS